MTSDDRFTNTPEDAAAFERYFGFSYDDGPDLQDVQEWPQEALGDPEDDPEQYLWLSDLLTREPPPEEPR